MNESTTRALWLTHRLLPLLLFFPLLFAAYRVSHTSYERLLATVDDDAFYYLLPAYRLVHEGQPSFDGRHVTYGYQPLWFVVCTGLAALVDSREDLLRLAMVTSASCYSVAGWLMWRWMTAGRRSRGIPTLLLMAATWALHYPMIITYWKVKENALHALILVCLLRVLEAAGSNRRRMGNAWGVGIFLGLLVLTRMNSFPVAIAGLAMLFFWIDRSSPDRLVRMGCCLTASLLTLLPWGVFAHHWYGAIWPTSGTAKMLDVQIGATVGKLFSLDFLRSLGVFCEPAGGIAGLFCLGVVVALCTRLLGWRRMLVRFRERGPSLTFLLLYAAFTHASTFALLRPYFEYATWYRVPQHLTLVALVGILLPTRIPSFSRAQIKLIAAASGIIFAGWILLQAARRLTHSPAWLETPSVGLAEWIHPWFEHGLRGHVLPSLVISVLLGLVVCFFLRGISPRQGLASKATGLLALLCVHAGAVCTYKMNAEPFVFTESPGTTFSDLTLACRWIERELPAGTVLAGANCGMTGYALEKYTVINLDGLANSPDFLATRRDPTRLRHYFKKEGVTGFVDVFREDDLRPEAKLFESLRHDEYSLSWVSPHRIPHWGGSRAAVVRLHEDQNP